MYGKTPRFKIDEYFELSPYLKKEFEFRGPCPVTGKKGGLILIEEPLQIILPYFDEHFIGIYTVEHFFSFLERMSIRFIRRHPRANVTIDKARRINNRLTDLSAKIRRGSCSILRNHQNSVTTDSDYHVEVHADFHISAGHRLYHPNSHNTLFHYTDLFTPEGIEEQNPHRLVDPKDWKHTYYYFDFTHCYLFHEIFTENRVNLDDLVLVGDVSLDYRLRTEDEVSF